MKTRNKWMYVGALASALTVAAVAQAGFKKDGDSGSAKFHAKGPAGLNIDGSAQIVVAQQEGSNLVFKADLNSVKTGISLRDEHTRKALNVSNSQFAVLRVPVKKIDVPGPGATKQGKTTGEFELNGKRSPVTFSYTAKENKGTYAVQGKFSFDYTKFGLEKQCYLKQCVDENIDVVARIKLKKD